MEIMENVKKYQADKVLTVYHKIDMDGIMSSMLAIRASKLIEENKSITYTDDFFWNILGYNYGKKIDEDPWLALVDSENKLLYNYVQFVDITPPLEYLEKCLPYLTSGELSIDIFDHHQNAYTDIMELFETNNVSSNNEFFNYYFNQEYSGAFIYWDSICNANWIFDRFGFLFGPLFLTKQNKSNFSVFVDLIKKPVPKVSEDNIIVANIKSTINDEINTNSMYKLIGMVSLWDTWGWYRNQDFRALYLNEGFMQNFKVKCSENLGKMYNMIFHENNTLNEYFLSNTIDDGKPISVLNFNLAKQSKHELFCFGGWNFVAINKSANFYDTENVKQKYINYNIDAVVYYTTSLLNNTVNISLRTVNSLLDCSQAVKLMTGGNGGGHFSAAGGQTSINQFFNLIIEKIDEIKIEQAGGQVNYE